MTAPSQQQAYLQRIRTLDPALTITSATLHTTEGQFNEILFVNDDLVFRFPRSAAVAAGYVGEAGVLNYLHGKLPLPTPLPLYKVTAEIPWQEVSLAYRRLPGAPLIRQRLAAIKEPQTLDRIAGQLVSFLQQLHQLPVDDLPAAVPSADELHTWQSFYNEVRRQLFPQMRPDARQALQRHFESYFDQPARLAYQPTLRHGDFGGSNILYDARSQQVSGVIDFESCAVGDPAADIAALATLGRPFLLRCLQAAPEWRQLLDRADFYQGTFALQEAYYGLRDGNRDAFERGMADYV